MMHPQKGWEGSQREEVGRTQHIMMKLFPTEKALQKVVHDRSFALRLGLYTLSSRTLFVFNGVEGQVGVSVAGSTARQS